MKLIFAQGNPGLQYATSRHNIGFTVLDAYAKEIGANFVEKAKLRAWLAEGQVNGEKILLAKPTTFYNETGSSARAIVDFYKLDAASDVLVAHDDIALPFGTIRVRQKGSPAGNNGIKSLNGHIGPDYWRMRLGIYNDLRDRMHDSDFVLSNLSKAEQKALKEDIMPLALQALNSFANMEIKPSSWKALPGNDST